jgi:hypothetical protein
MLFYINIQKGCRQMTGSMALLPKPLDLSRIELLSPQCECGVLPLYYRPKGLGRRTRASVIDIMACHKVYLYNFMACHEVYLYNFMACHELLRVRRSLASK